MLTVLGKNVVLCEKEVEQKTSAGIILQSDVSTGYKAADVVALGKDVDSGIREGDSVVVDWKKALPFEHKGVKLASVHIDDIKVILE